MSSSALTDPSATIPVSHKLITRKSWPEWITLFRHHARFRGIWPYVNPSNPDSVHVTLEAPRAPTIDRYIRQENARRQQQYRNELEAWELQAPAQRGARPGAPEVAGKRDIKAQYEIDRRDFPGRAAEWSAVAGKYVTLWNWVNANVDSTLLTSVLTELDLLQPDVDPSIQVVVRKLKERIAPSPESTLETTRTRYLKALETARRGSINPEVWYRQ